MVKYIIVKNPFEPANGRIIKTAPSGFTLQQIAIMEGFQGVEINCTVDGETVSAQNYVVPDGAIVAMSPVVGKGGGKSILGLVATVALAVVSFGVGGLASGAGMWGAGVGAWTTMGYIAAAATLFIGSTLVQRCFAADVGNVSVADTTTDPTYSWNGVQTLEGQNNAIALTYGKVKSGGQTIGKYVQTSGNNEYLNWLISAGEGPLTISNIMLNDNEIAYYSGVSVETRSGTNDQSVISNFNDTYFTKSLGYQLLDGYRTDTCQGNTTQGIVVRLECSNGLYYANNNGGLDEAWVDVQMEYKLKSSNSWTSWCSVRISGAQSSALRQEYRKDGLASGEYEVRIRVTGRSHDINSSRAATRIYWSSLTSVVYDDFAYPNIALIGIKALATDQISGTPTLSFIKERKYVWVYVPGAGYQQKPANNPAWAAYDMLHQAAYLKNVNTGAYQFEVRGAPASAIVYNQFAEWASFCASKQLYINIEITATGELLEILNSKIGAVGRGTVMRFGTRYGCVWNCAKQPVQMFGMGNIKPETFTEEFLQTSDRANCVEITFTNAEHDYEREVITIYSDEYDSDPEQKTAQATYDGITSYSQAYREGKYQLYANKYQLRTCSFEADIDAITCTIGDVILVAHDVPKWAYSGRIASVDVENNELMLPIEMTSTAGSWRVQYRTINDNLVTSNVTILSNANGYCKVKCSNTFSTNDPPQVGDIFDVAEASVGSKPFVVINITRAQDFTRTITCVEYAEALYNENYTIPPIQYSIKDNKRAKNVLHLNAKQTTFKNTAGVITSQLDISWERPENGGKFTVLLSRDNRTWDILKSGITADNISSEVEYGYNYYVKVITTLGVSRSSGVTVGPVEVGADPRPADVKVLNTELLANGTRRFWWQFDYPNPNDIAGFKLKYVQGNYPQWGVAFDLHTGLVTHQPFETDALRQGVHTVLIKAVDNSGQESENAIYTVLDLGDLLEENVLARDNVGENGWSKTCHNGLVVGNYLESRSNVVFWTSEGTAFWTKPTSEFWLERYRGFEMTYQFKAYASGQFWIDYDIEGPVQIKYLICGKDNYWTSPTAAFWGNTENDLAWSVVKNQWIPYTGRIMVDAGEQLQISVVAPDNISQATILKSMQLLIDVPDCQEHFEDLYVPPEGKVLSIKTPNYYTTAVRIDAVQGTGTNVFRAVVVNKKPCKIQVVDVDYTPIEATVDVTWQGYQKEVLV